MQVQDPFTISSDIDCIPWQVQGLIGTNKGGSNGEAGGITDSSGFVSGSFLVE
ncbi:MAG: hypothetical protein QM757_21400 [Paludibaculum sp.]